MDKIIEGDNLFVVKKLKDNSIDLIYIDPPFFSNKKYEIIWNDGTERRSFEDRWLGGKNHYLYWMEIRLKELHRILKETGNIFVHLDYRAVHYIKNIMDKIFDENNFHNEIIWCYDAASSPKQKQLARNHQTILWYSKSDKYKFYPDRVRENYSQTSLDREGYAKVSGWTDKSNVCQLNKKGKFPQDWFNIPYVRGNSEEHVGYPTQKPLKLLEKLILMGSDKGDLILDSFAGCGTSILASAIHKRKFIGIDISPTACKLMKNRLLKVGGIDCEYEKFPTSITELKKIDPFEFQDIISIIYNAISCKIKTGDMGIDAWKNNIPIQIKQQENVGRAEIDKFQTAIKRAGKVSGEIIAFSFTKGSYEEVARLKNINCYGNGDVLNIDLIKVEDILNGVKAQ